MVPYVILIIYVFCSYAFSKIIFPTEKAQNKSFLLLVFVYLYFFCVLRSFHVGTDIPGYVSAYEKISTMSWNDWHMHFEVGFLFLMKVCTHILHLDARGFLFVLYIIILVPIYLFLKKYSVSPFISLIYFFGFEYFSFALTGLRQAIGMSLCLLAFMVSNKTGKKYLLWSILIVLLAASMHKSALIFLPVYFVIRLPLNSFVILGYFIFSFFCVLLNKIGVAIILSAFETKYTYSQDYTLGLSLLLSVLIVALGFLTNYVVKVKKKKLHGLNEKLQSLELLNLRCIHLSLAAICTLFLFNGSILLRNSMYYQYYAMLTIPLFFKVLHRQYKVLVIPLFILFFVTHFFTGEIQTFNLIPYEIGVFDWVTL